MRLVAMTWCPARRNTLTMAPSPQAHSQIGPLNDSTLLVGASDPINCARHRYLARLDGADEIGLALLLD
jgi:hypothetical protein